MVDRDTFYRIWEWYAPLEKGGDAEVSRVAVVIAMFHCKKCNKKFPKSIGGYVLKNNKITKLWGIAEEIDRYAINYHINWCADLLEEKS